MAVNVAFDLKMDHPHRGLKPSVVERAPLELLAIRVGPGPWQNFKGDVVAQNVDDLHSDNNKLSMQTSLTERGAIIPAVGYAPNRHDQFERRVRREWAWPRTIRSTDRVLLCPPGRASFPAPPQATPSRQSNALAGIGAALFWSLAILLVLRPWSIMTESSDKTLVGAASTHVRKPSHNRTHALQQNSVVIRSSGPRRRAPAIRAERQLWNASRNCGSLCLDAREPDYLGPLLGFLGDQFPKISGRPGNHCRAQIGEPRLDLGIG